MAPIIRETTRRRRSDFRRHRYKPPSLGDVVCREHHAAFFIAHLRSHMSLACAKPQAATHWIAPIYR